MAEGHLEGTIVVLYTMYVHVCERQDELMTLGGVIFCVLLAQAVGLTY